MRYKTFEVLGSITLLTFVLAALAGLLRGSEWTIAGGDVLLFSDSFNIFRDYLVRSVYSINRLAISPKLFDGGYLTELKLYGLHKLFPNYSEGSTYIILNNIICFFGFIYLNYKFVVKNYLVSILVAGTISLNIIFYYSPIYYPFLVSISLIPWLTICLNNISRLESNKNIFLLLILIFLCNEILANPTIYVSTIFTCLILHWITSKRFVAFSLISNRVFLIGFLVIISPEILLFINYIFELLNAVSNNSVMVATSNWYFANEKASVLNTLLFNGSWQNGANYLALDKNFIWEKIQYIPLFLWIIYLYLIYKYSNQRKYYILLFLILLLIFILKAHNPPIGILYEVLTYKYHLLVPWREPYNKLSYVLLVLLVYTVQLICINNRRMHLFTLVMFFVFAWAVSPYYLTSYYREGTNETYAKYNLIKAAGISNFTNCNGSATSILLPYNPDIPYKNYIYNDEINPSFNYIDKLNKECNFLVDVGGYSNSNNINKDILNIISGKNVDTNNFSKFSQFLKLEDISLVAVQKNISNQKIEANLLIDFMNKFCSKERSCTIKSLENYELYILKSHPTSKNHDITYTQGSIFIVDHSGSEKNLTRFSLLDLRISFNYKGLIIKLTKVQLIFILLNIVQFMFTISITLYLIIYACNNSCRWFGRKISRRGL
ncbi:hypothetical protein G6661_01775 [Polynucleobacter paneuropaeus]|nr:hypothetical protein G6661_01775 [Polynucleobacter paneuropaeus]